MNAADIVGYTFQADTYCPRCIGFMFSPDGDSFRHDMDAVRNAEVTLIEYASANGIDRSDEHSFDSGEFPKVIFADQVHSGDEPDYCGRCHELLAPYECEICGDEHGESAHGEPLVQRDQDARSTTEAVSVYLMDAQSIIGPGAQYDALESLWADYEAHTDDERDEYAPEYLDDIDAILSDAGFHPVTNSEGGAWMVYGPARTPSPCR